MMPEYHALILVNALNFAETLQIVTASDTIIKIRSVIHPNTQYLEDPSIHFIKINILITPLYVTK